MKSALTILLLTTTLAHATPDPECRPYIPSQQRRSADALTLRGVACFEAGDFLQALILYRQAERIKPSPTLLGAIGRTLQEMNFPELARHYYLEYLEQTDPKTEGYQRIQQRLDTIQQTLTQTPAITLRTLPADTPIYLHLQDHYYEFLGHSPITLRFDPGTYQIVAMRDGFRPAQTHFQAPGSDLLVTLTPDYKALENETRWRTRGNIGLLAALPFAAGAAGMFVAAEYSDHAPTYRTIGSVSAGLSLSALAAGIIFHMYGAPATPPLIPASQD